MMYPSRRAQVDAFRALDVMGEANRLAAGGADLMRLEIGQPAEGAPAPVLEAAQKALRDRQLGYTEASGIESLRRRIAERYGEQHDLDIAPARILVTSGSSAGFVLAFLALFEAGEQVAIGSPYYPAYPNILRALGLEPKLLELAAPAFRLTPESIRAAMPAAGLIATNPSNPTGTLLGAAELGALAQITRETGLRLVVDEIYHGITFERAATTILSHTDEVAVVNSFSKYYCLTGWRIGWLVVPEAMARPIEILAQSLYISPPTLAQHTALAALSPEAEAHYVARVARYRASRDRLMADLMAAGFASISPAEGAFYIYAELASDWPDSEEFCRAMLHEAGVCATPGTDFDAARGHRAVRFSFAGPGEGIAEAGRRLIDWQGGATSA